MEILLDDFSQIVKIGGIIFALFHFLAGFVMYIDLLRINKVIVTNRRRQITIIANMYLLSLLAILIFIALL